MKKMKKVEKCFPNGKKDVMNSADVGHQVEHVSSAQNGTLGCGAYSNESVKHIKMREPIKVNSLYYDNMDFEHKESTSDNLGYQGQTYYDPSDEIYGDQVICNMISNPHICVAQSICGWCGADQKCVLGTTEKPKQPCSNIKTYQYSNCGGWDPSCTTPCPPLSTTIDDCGKPIGPNLYEYQKNSPPNIFNSKTTQ